MKTTSHDRGTCRFVAGRDAARLPFQRRFNDIGQAVDKLNPSGQGRHPDERRNSKLPAPPAIGDVQFDEESGEGDTLAVERDLDLALSAQARDAVDEIDAALDRIRTGTYGICTTSGQPIPKARLKAIPWAAERVEVKAGGLGRR